VASSQAGEFVREEIIRPRGQARRGFRKQAIAIGLEARRAGVL
jgi:hypothetical protein